MPTTSPSPAKRPSLMERTSSTHSLSSSGRQPSDLKVRRPHVVNRHSRNVSHGKGLNKLGKNHSTANVTGDGRQHQRKRSGASTPPQSPGGPVRRNTSHVTLSKNTSHANLRKNLSANALTIAHRNLSHPALKKAGLAPVPKSKHKNKGRKDGMFQLGDKSSDDGEEEAEWEDSATQSPEMTRNNSKTSTPARTESPNGKFTPQKAAEKGPLRRETTSSPPLPSLKNNNINRSAPNLRKQSDISPTAIPQDLVLLQQNPRSSRAPPAMSTVSALADPNQLRRNDSSKSFNVISHSEVTSIDAAPATSGPINSSVDGGVSHFLPVESHEPSHAATEVDSDEDSAFNFMTHYKPQPSESPEKTRTLHKLKLTSNQTRTNQRLELQRREALRTGASTPATPPSSGMGLGIGSSTSLHSRASSRTRNRSIPGNRLAGDIKAARDDYETAMKQLAVVRRFRDPIIESMNRLKEKGLLAAEIGMPATKTRPQSRRGPTANGRAAVSRSMEEQRSSPLISRSNSRGRGGRVQFQRQTSHDDIEVTPSHGSPDSQDGDNDGLSPEEALIRRIWNSREVYDMGENGAAR